MTTALAAAHDPPGAGVSTQPPRAAKKRSRASRTSATDRMATPAEQLWSGKTRGFFEFDPIPPTNGLELGAVGVAVGSKGRAAFFSYLKQPKVIARLEAEGFERAGRGAPHAWYLRLEPGVVAPGEKALRGVLAQSSGAPETLLQDCSTTPDPSSCT